MNRLALLLVMSQVFVSIALGQLNSHANQVFRQGAGGLAEMAEPADSFGSSLVTADFSTDGYVDLAIGVPGENEA